MQYPYDKETTLGHTIFSKAQFRDRRRNMRAAKVFDKACKHPGGSLPQKMASPAALKGLYRLCASKGVSHEAMIEASREYTRQQIDNTQGDVLIIHDATELDYSTLKSLGTSLGQIGRGTRKGYICQNVLAVSADRGEVLGLFDQILHRRANVPKSESLTEKRNRPTRESLLWPHGTQHLPSEHRLIDVADQGASTFEFIEHECHSGRRFVIRNGRTRRCLPVDDPAGEPLDMKSYVSDSPELGRFTMDVQKQKDRRARKDAEFAVRGLPLLLCPPHAKHGHHGNDPLLISVVQVLEVNPPKGEKVIEWTLLTNEPVESFEDAYRVIGWYELRWIVEEYHKAKKTGCGIEDLQFTAIERLQPAIAMISIIALTLLNLREASRRPDAKTRRATDLIHRDYVKVLHLWRHQKACEDWSVHEFTYALARLGGHQNRKGDHRPGWLILWRGFTKLQLMLDGYLAAEQT